MGSYVNNNFLSGELVVSTTTYHSNYFSKIKSLLTLFIAPLFAKYSDEFALNNKRIIMKNGLIAIRTLELNLSKVESVLVNQTLVGRVLGFGDVVIIGTGVTRKTLMDN